MCPPLMRSAEALINLEWLFHCLFAACSHYHAGGIFLLNTHDLKLSDLSQGDKITFGEGGGRGEGGRLPVPLAPPKKILHVDILTKYTCTGSK